MDVNVETLTTNNMSYTTAIAAVILGSMIAVALLYPWFQDEEKLPALID